MSADTSWQPEFQAEFKSGRYHMVPFCQLSHEDQRRARARYPHKRVGAKYDFVDEHYLYPVNKDGKLTVRRGAMRLLGIPLRHISDDDYMASIGYEKNRGW